MCVHAPIGLKCAPLDPACRYDSFGTLVSQIRQTVKEILTYLALVNGRWTDDGPNLPHVELSRIVNYKTDSLGQKTVRIAASCWVSPNFYEVSYEYVIRHLMH